MQEQLITVTSSHSFNKGRSLSIKGGKEFVWTFESRQTSHKTRVTYDSSDPEDVAEELEILWEMFGIVEDIQVSGCTMDELYTIIYNHPIASRFSFINIYRCECKGSGGCLRALKKSVSKFPNVGSFFAGIGDPAHSERLSVPYFEYPDSVCFRQHVLEKRVDIYGEGHLGEITETIVPDLDPDNVYILGGYDR